MIKLIDTIIKLMNTIIKLYNPQNVKIPVNKPNQFEEQIFVMYSLVVSLIDHLLILFIFFSAVPRSSLVLGAVSWFPEDL